MRIHQATVNRKGQITVPKEVRDALGLRDGDRVNIIQREERVEIERAGGVVATTAGIFRGRAPSMTAEELRDLVEQEIADDAVARMNDEPIKPVHVRTYGVAAPRSEPIDLDLARQMFAENRAIAFVEMDEDSSPDLPTRADATTQE